MDIKDNTINCAALLTYDTIMSTCQFTASSDLDIRSRKRKASHSDKKKKKEKRK